MWRWSSITHTNTIAKWLKYYFLFQPAFGRKWKVWPVVKYFILFYLILSYTSASSFIAHFSCGIFSSNNQPVLRHWWALWWCMANLRSIIHGISGEYFIFFYAAHNKIFKKNIFLCAHTHTQANMLIGQWNNACFVVSYTSVVQLRWSEIKNKKKKLRKLT